MSEEAAKKDETGESAPERSAEDERRREDAASEARVREIVELAARVRHEINNPLTGIIGQAQLLLRDETLGEAARRRVQTIEQLAKRIRDTVAELRTVQHAGGARAPEAVAPQDAGQTDEPPRH